MEEDSDFSKLSIEEKCLHKSWKARVSAYTELDKLFLQQNDTKSQDYNKYSHLIKNMVVDNNVLALEKGLKATLTFMENSSNANKICGAVISGIIDKCLGSPKEKIKDLAMQIIYTCIEIEKYDTVSNELLRGFENKSPKTVNACIITLTNSLKFFGPNVINIKPIIKNLIKLLEDRDKLVRENAKILAVEIYRWIKDSLRGQLSKLKPVQLNELEAEFSKIKDEIAKPTRYIRSNQSLQLNQGENGIKDFAEDEQIDPAEFLEELNLFEKLPKDFYTNCQSNKWQDRKEALNRLLELISNVKLGNGDYSEIVKILKKIISKDSNIVVIVLGAQSLTALVKALRKNFTPYASTCVPVILEKFREKKQNVVQSLRDAIDALMRTISLEAVHCDIQASLECKNPQTKAETALFLARYLTPSKTILSNKKLLKAIVSSLLKTLGDTDPSVRDASADALGKLYKVAGEKVIGPFLQDLEPTKLTKIKEVAEKGSQSNTKTPSKTISTSNNKIEARKIGKTPLKPNPLNSSLTRKPSKLMAQVKKNEVKASKDELDASILVEEKNLSEEDVQVAASEFLGSESVSNLSNSNWKTRLDAVAAMKDVVEAKSSDVPVQALVKFLVLNKGLKEINQQVLRSKLELLNLILTKGKVSRWTLECCFPDLVEKIGDLKMGELVSRSLSLLAAVSGQAEVVQQVLPHAFTFKNPKIQAEALNWVATSIKESGLKMATKVVVEHLKMAFASTNAIVRTAALNLLGVLSWYTGPDIRAKFDALKPALLSLIDAELAKRMAEKPPAPLNSLDCGDSVSNRTLGTAPLINGQVGDTRPRKDIAPLVNPLLEDLSSKDWKVRSAALCKLNAILEEAHFVHPNLNGLPNALSLKLKDPNKNIAIQALTILETLGKALGPHCHHFASETMPALFSSLADSKLTLRNQALKSLTAWQQEIRFSAFSDPIQEALKPDNMLQRTGVLQFLSATLAQRSVTALEIEPLLPVVFSLVEDRSVEVRKKSQEVIGLVIGHVGFEFVHRAANKSKHKDAALEILQKLKSAPVAGPKPTDRPTSAPLPSKTQEVRPKMPAARPKNGLPANIEDPNKPQLFENNLKEQRMIDEKILKSLKWSFATPQEEHVQQLKKQMTCANWGPLLLSHCFHSDFKFHLKALDILKAHLSLPPVVTISNLDLILKWCTLRLADNNSTALNHTLEYLLSLLDLLRQQNYILQDLEASSFLPFFLPRLGDPKDATRKQAKTILIHLQLVYPLVKIVGFLVQALSPKNSRQRAECLEALGTFFEEYDFKAQSLHLKEIAKHIEDKDCAVRNSALNCITKAYRTEGERVLKILGPLPEKSQSLLDERIKRAANDSLRSNLQSSPYGSKSLRRSSTLPITKSSPPLKAENDVSPDRIKEEVGCDLKAVKVKLMPELIKVNTEEVLSHPEIKMPEIKTVLPVTIPKQNDMLFNMKIAQLMDSDLAIAGKAFSEMESLVNSDPILIKPYIRRILMNGCSHLKLASTHYARHERSRVIELLKAITKCFSAIFDRRELASQIARLLLQELLPALLSTMLDQQLGECEDGPQVVRSINVIIMRIFQNCQPNSVMCALIRLISEPSPSEKFQEVVVKCLFKMNKMIDQHTDRLDLKDLMNQFHTFLIVCPPSYWKAQTSNQPLKAVKTYLYNLVKYKGNEVYNILKFLPGLDNSNLEVYIRKLLLDLQQNNYTADGISFTLGQDFNALNKIFQKIISDKCSKEGLLELYQWTKKNPGASLEEILKNTSLEFQQDIKERLDKIHREVISKTSNSSPPVLTNLPIHTERLSDSHQNFSVHLPQDLDNLSSQELIAWLRSMAQVLKQDDTKYSDPNILSQIQSIFENSLFQSLPFSKEENEQISKNLNRLRQLADEFKSRCQENLNP